jgi:hypothetical protein
MKIPFPLMKSVFLGIILMFAGLNVGMAAEKGAAVDAARGGPNGGRVMDLLDSHFELLIRKDRRVEIIALTKELKPSQFTGQSIGVVAGDRRNPTKLELVKEADKLVSRNALPEGSGYTVSVSLKAAAGGKTVYDRFNLNLAKCPDCAFLEYACVCAHGKEAQRE